MYAQPVRRVFRGAKLHGDLLLAFGLPGGLLCDHCHDPDDPTRPSLFNGSALPPLKSGPTVWKAGSVAEAGWGLAVNHGEFSFLSSSAVKHQTLTTQSNVTMC